MSGTIDVSNETELNQAIATVDAASAGSYVIQFTQSITEGTDRGGTVVFQGNTLSLPPDLFALNLQSGVSVTIDGAGNTLDGAGLYRGLFAYAGAATVENLAIADAKAKGGAGGSGTSGGGGGAGLGGGLFVAAGAQVTLNEVNFITDGAIGGVGGDGGEINPDVLNAIGGGGGLGGAGGNGPGGGGGIGINAVGGGVTNSSGAGIVLGATGGGGGGFSAGGGSGGGGGSGFQTSGAGGGGVGGAGGSSHGARGGFGGGGGSGVDGGAGGFGGGGAGGNSGGSGGFGGGGGGGFTPGAGGFGGGGANQSNGGGGLGAGGDIFVQQGGALTIEGGSLSGGSVTGGVGGSFDGSGGTQGAGGSAFGSGIFLQGNQAITLAPTLGETLTIADTLTDQSANGGNGTGNAGAGTLDLVGPGTVALDGTTDLSGSIALDAGVLQIGDASHSSATVSTEIVFGGIAALDVNSVATGVPFIDTVGNFAAGGTIDLTGVNNNSVIYANSLVTYDLPDSGSAAFGLDLASGVTAGQVHITSDGSGGTDITVLCFLRGTRIVTPSGDMAVEALRIGDLVQTHVGAAKPVRWIGRARARGVVTVRASALADRVPCRDLRVTKGHSLFLDGALIPVENLVNGRSIVREERAAQVFHLALEAHEVLIADGAAAESYRDDGNGALFDGPVPAWTRQPPCAPVLANGPQVEHIWRRLLDRAGGAPQVETTRDANLHLVADGKPIDAALVDGPMHLFRLDRCPRVLRIASRSATPALLGLNADQRRLGVALSGIVLRSAGAVLELGPEAAALSDGFHAPEPAWRWTDGDADVPGALLGALRGPLIIELHVACWLAYVADNPVTMAA